MAQHRAQNPHTYTKTNRRGIMSLVFRNVFLLLFLLLEALFTSSAALTVNERQRDDAAGVKGPKRVRSDGGPPENLVAVGISESVINVSWTPPAYEPQYYLVSAPPCVYLNDVVFGLSYLITGLDPCRSCSVFVTSYYNDTFQYTAETRGSSQGGDPPPPESCSVEVQADVITVTWERPDTNCLLGLYSGDWTGTKLWGDGEEVSGSMNTSGTKFVVFAPVPYSQYTFEISASIDGVFGSPASCSGTSQETQPGPPVILAADPLQGEVLVIWETPVEENGFILNYGIYVDEAIDPQVTVSGDVHSTSLGLEQCKTYGISVNAENGAGWGPPSEVKNVTIVDGC